MFETQIYIIIAALLLPLNLLCSFWIFRELLNLSSVTYRELLGSLAPIAIPSGRFGRGLRRRKRILINYLTERSSEPEKTKAIFKAYLYSLIPASLSAVLTEYITFSGSSYKNKIAVIGIIILALINFVIYGAGKIYRAAHPLDERTKAVLEEKRQKHQLDKSNNIKRNMPVYILIVIIVLVAYIGVNLGMASVSQISNQGRNDTDIQSNYTNTYKLEFSAVHTVLNDRGFETANIPTTYWYFDEDNLENVVAGKKENCKFEFYEYTNGSAAEEVYNCILNELAKNTQPSSLKEHEKSLNNGGKIVVYEDGNTKHFLLCKNDVIVYTYAPDDTEILEILDAFGCTVEQ